MATYTKMAEVPNPLLNASGSPASGYVLKCYLPGTTTTTSMATSRTGGTTVSTMTTNAEGKWEVSGNEVVPHIDRRVKWGIFENAANATANTPFFMGPFDTIDQSYPNIYAGGTTTSSGVVDLLSDLKALTDQVDDDVVLILGHTTVADGGGGLFRWDASDTTTDDNGVYIQPDAGGTGRWIRLHTDNITPYMFGAVGDGVTDDTAAIQATIDAVESLLIPYGGTFAIEGTIVVSGTAKNLLIEGDITRTGTATTPLIRLDCARSSIISRGSSRITTPNNSPDGILLVGPVDPSTDSQTNILWNRISLSLTGNQNAASNGIVFKTKEGYGSSEANYFNWIDNCFVENVNQAVWIQANANGQMIRGLQTYRITANCVFLDGTTGTGSVSDCTVSDVSVHQSSSLDNIIKCSDANRNTFVNIGGEPGGGKVSDFDATSTNNVLIGLDNTPGSSVDSGNNNVRIYNGFTRYSSNTGSGGFIYIEEPSYTPTFTCTTSGTITLSTSADTLNVTRLGRDIRIQGSVDVSSVSSPVGDLQISVPIASITDSEGEGNYTGTILIGNAAGNANAYGILGPAGQSYFTVRRTDATNLSTQCAADFSGDEVIYIDVTYRSTSSS